MSAVQCPERALVTGGAGFIGSHIADALLAGGSEVWVFDDLSTGRKENVPKGAHLQVGSICDDQALRAVLAARPSVVYHLAAQMDVRRSVREPLFDATVNVMGSLRLLLASVEAGVEQVIYASSGGAAYGDVAQLPVSEARVPCPVSEYGASKVAVEHYLSVYQSRGLIRTVALRFPNVFGRRQRPDGEAGVVAIFAGRLLARQACEIFGDGSKTRDYVHVSDIVQGALSALAAPSGRTYNLGSGTAVSDREVYDTVARVVGSGAEPTYRPFRPGEVMHVTLDSSAALKEFGWSPKRSFEDGVREVVEWLKAR